MRGVFPKSNLWDRMLGSVAVWWAKTKDLSVDLQDVKVAGLRHEGFCAVRRRLYARWDLGLRLSWFCGFFEVVWLKIWAF